MRDLRALTARQLTGYMAMALLLGGCSKAEPPPQELARVVVQRLQPLDDKQTIAFTGDIQARIQTPLAFRVGGKIGDRRADVGDRVKAGQVVARLDPQDLRNNLASAQAQVDAQQARLRLAQVDFQRQATLLPKGYTSRSQYDRAQATLEGARSGMQTAVAQRDDARKQLGYSDLTASAAGVLTGRHAEVGQVVQAGTAIFDLAVAGERDAVFDVYEALARRLEVGQVVQIALQDQPDVRASGHIREIAPTVAARSGTVRVKAQVEALPPTMSLGAVVTASLSQGQTQAQRLEIPWTALNGTVEQPAVWILDEEDRARLQPLRIERYTRDRIVVADGLQPEDRVVIAGGQALSPNQRVEVAERSTFVETQP